MTTMTVETVSKRREPHRRRALFPGVTPSYNSEPYLLCHGLTALISGAHTCMMTTMTVETVSERREPHRRRALFPGVTASYNSEPLFVPRFDDQYDGGNRFRAS